MSSPAGFQPIAPPLSLVCGACGGAALVVLAAQFAVVYPTGRMLLAGALLGALVSVLAANAACWMARTTSVPPRRGGPR